jgi:hypothetical protein
MSDSRWLVGAPGTAARLDALALWPTRAPETRPLSAFECCRYDDPSTHANAEPSQASVELIGGPPRGMPDSAVRPKVETRVVFAAGGVTINAQQ